MIRNHECYFPLYEDTEHPIILITGGRGSGKSFGASTFIDRLTFEYNKEIHKPHMVLYTRYTMVSAGISIIPEAMEKIELDGLDGYFKTTKTDIVNKLTGSRIMFRGIHTSSGNQTAKLKSIQGVTTFVCDEAEEWTSYDEFEKIFLSMRQKGLQIRAIIIMNPSDTNHWVYEKYIKDTHKEVEFDGVKVQISTHPDVLHIHTTYLDNLEHLSGTFVDMVRKMKETDPERYAHIVMGRWDDVAEGAVFKNWGIVDEFPSYAKKVARAVDFGYTCFRGDTLITTLRGDVPIRDIVPGDLVLTRQGYRRVLRKMCNGQKEVVGKELTIADKKVRIYATEEHNFNVNGKWKKYGQLTKKDKLFVLSSSKGKFTRGTRMASMPTITLGSTKRMEYIIVNYFTTKSTESMSGKYHPGMSSTIGIETRLIITPRTCSCLRLRNMLRSIGISLGGIMKSILDTLRRLLSRNQTGINGANWSSEGLRERQGFVRDAERSSAQQIRIRSFAKSHVIENGDCKPLNALLQGNAKCAERSIGQTSTIHLAPAQASVLIEQQALDCIREISRMQCDVYDLEIEDVHEYFANGILVHNCDPSAIVRCGIVDNRLYLDELCYKTLMKSSDLIREFREEEERGEDGFIYSESADPRLIDEIALGGLIIYPVMKGPGSIMAGITKMLSMEIYVTKRSVHLQEELRNYVYAKDKDGHYINEPEDHDNHLVDAARYYVMAVLLGKVAKPRALTKEDLGIY